MAIVIKNSQLTNDTIEALNTLIDLDINATVAFRLTRVIKELSSIVEDKMKMERKILEKWAEKDENGLTIQPLDNEGNPIQGAVNITDMNAFNSEMESLMEFENEISYEKINFEDLDLQRAKIKDLIKLEFLFN
jgi:hypothetical protein